MLFELGVNGIVNVTTQTITNKKYTIEDIRKRVQQKQKKSKDVKHDDNFLNGIEQLDKYQHTNKNKLVSVSTNTDNINYLEGL